MNKNTILIVLIVALAISGFAIAQSSIMLYYQGQLMHKQGLPFSGTYNVIFRIYAASTGGTALWTQEFASLDLTDGKINVMLGGPASPLPEDIFSNSTRYLEIVVGGETLSPRMRITSAMYAISGPQQQQMVCDSGWVQVSNVCVEYYRRPAATYLAAIQTCASLNARICTWTDLMYACEEKKIDVNNGYALVEEWAGNGITSNRLDSWADPAKTSLPYCYRIATEVVLWGSTYYMLNYRCCK